MKKIAIVSFKPLDPQFGVGGVQNVVFSIIESLQDLYHIALFYPQGVINFDIANKQYGTKIDSKKLEVFEIPKYDFFSKLYLFRRSLMVRALRKKIDKFDCDLIISGDRELDIGGGFNKKYNIIQCLHSLSIAPIFFENSKNIFQKIYRKICSLISPFRIQELRKNITVADSLYEAGVLKQRYKIESVTIYPPISAKFFSTKKENKKNSFVILGRISSEKKIEDAVNILKIVRKQFPSVTLDIVGFIDNDVYGQFIKQMIEEEKSWINYHGSLCKDEYEVFLSNKKYGIHCRSGEPFGIVIVDMIKLGLVPFVPKIGGPAEIINNQQELIFDTLSEGAEKIIKVLSDSALEDKLRNRLLLRAQDFYDGKFKNEIRKIVEKQLGS